MSKEKDKPPKIVEKKFKEKEKDKEKKKHKKSTSFATIFGKTESPTKIPPEKILAEKVTIKDDLNIPTRFEPVSEGQGKKLMRSKSQKFTKTSSVATKSPRKEQSLIHTTSLHSRDKDSDLKSSSEPKTPGGPEPKNARIIGIPAVSKESGSGGISTRSGVSKVFAKDAPRTFAGNPRRLSAVVTRRASGTLKKDDLQEEKKKAEI